MLQRHGARVGASPVRKQRKWLPGMFALAVGLTGITSWAGAQTPGQPKPMPLPGSPGAVLPVTPMGSTSPSATDKPAVPEKTVTVNFKSANWDDVLEWFSKESGLTPILTVKPTGSVTLQPHKDRRFTMGEVVDLLNEAMTQQRFILIRRNVTFIIHPSDEKIDASWVPRIELAELPTRGKTELVQVLIPLKSLSVEDTAPEVAKMLTPFGTVSMLAKTNTLVLLDTAGNLTRIYQTIKSVEDDAGTGDILTHVCKWKRAAEVAETLKTLLTDSSVSVAVSGASSAGYPQYGAGGYDPRQAYGGAGGYDPRTGYGGPGGGGPRRDGGTGGPTGRVKSVQIAVDVKANSLTITAPPEKIGLAKKIIEENDKPRGPLDRPITISDPIIQKYSVPTGTADAIAKTLQENHKTVRIMALPLSNEIMVYATPEEHLAIAAQIKFGDGAISGPTQATISISSDPTEMATKLTKLFPSTTNPGLIIEAGIGQPSVIVRGTAAQIQEVQKTIYSMEGREPGVNLDPRRRTFYLPEGSASVLAEHIKKAVETTTGNPVEVRTQTLRRRRSSSTRTSRFRRRHLRRRRAGTIRSRACRATHPHRSLPTDSRPCGNRSRAATTSTSAPRWSILSPGPTRRRSSSGLKATG